jgi:hypothetical protein
VRWLQHDGCVRAPVVRRLTSCDQSPRLSCCLWADLFHKMCAGWSMQMRAVFDRVQPRLLDSLLDK